MIQFIFDEGTANEKQFDAQNYTEDLLKGVLFAQCSHTASTLPEKSTLPTETFTTIKVTDGDTILTLQQTYTSINSLIIGYASDTKTFDYSLELRTGA